MSTFHEVNEAHILDIMKHSSSKSCSLNPIPTHLLLKCKTIVFPLTKLINSSLNTGVVPNSFKHALITPLINNSKLDSNSMSSYRPVSNLKYISKLLEQCI